MCQSSRLGRLLGSHRNIHVFQTDSISGVNNCTEVLLIHTSFFTGALDPDSLFMNDNAKPHRTVAGAELLENDAISTHG